jgi:predicted transposase/invertase (TIGR01784 family)
MNSNTDAQNALHQIDDKLFKVTFQTLDALLAFLERYVPEHLLKHIDLTALELDVTEYVNKDLRKFQSDIVWRATFKGEPLKIVLLFEHKKDLDKAVYVQILLYLCLIWLLELQQGKPMSCVLPILVHQGEGGASWDDRNFHHYFQKIPAEFLEYIPNFKFFLMHVQKVPNENILQMPETNLLRALFLAYKCAGDEEIVKQLFEEIFKFYDNQPHLREVVHQFLLYLMESAKMSPEKILALIQSFNNQKKKIAMTTYEQIVVKNQTLGEAIGDKLRILKIIWKGAQRKAALEEIADYAEMTPLLVKKWIAWMQLMLQEDENGLTAAGIAAKINEAGAEPDLTPNEVQKLLIFLKTPLPQIVKKTRTRKSK